MGLLRSEAKDVAQIYNRFNKIKYISFLPIQWRPMDGDRKATLSFVLSIAYKTGERSIRLYYFYKNKDSGIKLANGKCVPFYGLRKDCIDEGRPESTLPPRLKNYL